MTRRALLTLAALLLLCAPARGQGPSVLRWTFPEPVERLAPAAGAGGPDAPPLMAATAGRVLYVARPDPAQPDAAAPSLARLLPLAAAAPEALQAGTWRGAPAVFCLAPGEAVAVPLEGGEGRSVARAPGMVWRVADLDGDGRDDLWGTDGRSLAAALQDADGGFLPVRLDLPAPPAPAPARREAWRVSAGRAAEAVQARSEASFRVWADDLDGDGAAELTALDEQARTARVYRAERGGFRPLFAADLAALGAAGDVFLLDLDGDGRAEAARLRLLAPGEEGAVLPMLALDVFPLSGSGPLRAAGARPALRLTTVFAPEAEPLVRAGPGWAFLALAPRLPASAGETARLAAGGELELSLRVARFVPSPDGPAVSWDAGAGRLTLPAAADPRLAAGPCRAAGGARPGVAVRGEGRLLLVSPRGAAEIPARPGAFLLGSAEAAGRSWLLLREDGGRAVRGAAW